MVKSYQFEVTLPNNMRELVRLNGRGNNAKACKLDAVRQLKRYAYDKSKSHVVEAINRGIKPAKPLDQWEKAIVFLKACKASGMDYDTAIGLLSTIK